MFQESYLDKRKRALLHVTDFAAELNLPPCPGTKKKPGKPSHQFTWLRGVYLALDDVAMGKIQMPPRHLLTAEPHKAFLSLPKFTEQTVRKHFSSVVAQENAAEEFATDEDEFEDASSPETPGRCKKRMKLRKYYQLHEMEIFEDLRLIHEGKTLNAICELAKAQLPSIFLPRTKYETFKRFPAMIAREAAKKKAIEDAKEAQRKAGIERSSTTTSTKTTRYLSPSARSWSRRCSYPKRTRWKQGVAQTTKSYHPPSSWASPCSFGAST